MSDENLAAQSTQTWFDIQFISHTNSDKLACQFQMYYYLMEKYIEYVVSHIVMSASKLNKQQCPNSSTG